jgi:hypothetical protein
MFNRINLVQCKIALGFVLTAIVFYVFKDNVAEAQNISHYGMTVWLHVLAVIKLTIIIRYLKLCAIFLLFTKLVKIEYC